MVCKLWNKTVKSNVIWEPMYLKYRDDYGRGGVVKLTEMSYHIPMRCFTTNCSELSHYTDLKFPKKRAYENYRMAILQRKFSKIKQKYALSVADKKKIRKAKGKLGDDPRYQKWKVLCKIEKETPLLSKIPTYSMIPDTTLVSKTPLSPPIETLPFPQIEHKNLIDKFFSRWEYDIEMENELETVVRKNMIKLRDILGDIKNENGQVPIDVSKYAKIMFYTNLLCYQQYNIILPIKVQAILIEYIAIMIVSDIKIPAYIDSMYYRRPKKQLTTRKGWLALEGYIIEIGKYLINTTKDVEKTLKIIKKLQPYQFDIIRRRQNDSTTLPIRQI